MTKKLSYALKISGDTRKRLKQFCESRGMLQANLVEQAVVEKLDREELLEDALEFKRWKHEEPHRMLFETYLKERGRRKRAKASSAIA